MLMTVTQGENTELSRPSEKVFQMTKPEKESKRNQQPTDASTVFCFVLFFSSLTEAVGELCGNRYAVKVI